MKEFEKRELYSPLFFYATHINKCLFLCHNKENERLKKGMLNGKIFWMAIVFTLPLFTTEILHYSIDLYAIDFS